MAVVGLASACSTSEPDQAVEAPLSAQTQADAELVARQVANRIYEPINRIDVGPIERLGASSDPRAAWIVADALRFVGRGDENDALIAAGEKLAGIELEPTTAWLKLNNHLLTEDVAAPPTYLALKAEMFEAVDITWTHFFSDPKADIDWRLVSFGGVRSDRRSYGTDESCLCIPSLDDPPSVPASEGDWYPDDEVVFGIVVNGEARAYPRNIMATHEMVNDVLGGQRLGIAYCTLCRSAHAYLLDDLPDEFDQAALRTSGLLNRSNKITMDLQTLSMVDTFTGRALSGPWREAGIELTALPVVVTTWVEWRNGYPNTTLMAGKNGTGPIYPLELIQPIVDGGLAFPVGRVDRTLFPETAVLGVIGPDGQPVAFERSAARTALAAGDAVAFEDIQLILDAGGLRAFDADGIALRSHEASWFAWSQFNPETLLWRHS